MAAFYEGWDMMRRAVACAAAYAILGVLFYLNGLAGTGIGALLVGAFAANSIFFYRGIVRPLKALDRLYLRFNRGYDPEAIFDRPVYYTQAEREALEKIRKRLDNHEVNRLSNRQAQYLALQNQINPHFLYNTLEAIRGDALSAGMRNIADITEALATFFRYTISNMDNLVTLEEELANAENYFAIQNYRFGDRIAMRVEMAPGSEAARDFLVPKLTLQPIIENAIIHGLENKVGAGQVTVRIAVDGPRLSIEVADDGVGMPEEKVDDINRRLAFPELVTCNEEKSRAGHIALVNVNNRIKLLFGEPYGLRISSVEGIGCRVDIALPVRRNTGG